MANGGRRRFSDRNALKPAEEGGFTSLLKIEVIIVHCFLRGILCAEVGLIRIRNKPVFVSKEFRGPDDSLKSSSAKFLRASPYM